MTDEIIELLNTRDLRYYGIEGHSTQDLRIQWQLAREKPMSVHEATRSAYLTALPHLDERTQAKILSNLKRCSPLPLNYESENV